MEGDRSIVKRDTLKYDEATEKVLEEKYQFRKEIERKNYLMGKLYNNVFIEIIRDSAGKTKALNALDPNNIEPNTEPNGDPIKYYSKTRDPITGSRAEWDKNDIVWIKYGDRSQGYAPVDFKALFENLSMKFWVKRYVAWLWKTGQYRVAHVFKQASDAFIQDFIAYNHKHENDFKAPSIIKGDYEAKIIRDMKETDSITTLLEYYDNQTLILLRVPPIDAGIPDASGRSSSDAQSNNLVTHVQSWKKQFQDSVNYDLFPKISKANSLLRYSPVDRFAEKMVLENVQMMKSAGFTNEACTEYMQDKGMFWIAKVFEPVEVQSKQENPRDLDNMPSRTGKGEGQANAKVGTGEQGTSREDQVGEE